jgi:hypothetical protein
VAARSWRETRVPSRQSFGIWAMNAGSKHGSPEMDWGSY